MGEIVVRPITETEVDRFRVEIARNFGDDTDLTDDTRRTRFLATFELDRTVAAIDGDTMVGTGAAFSLEVTVPGGVVPMGGTTVITVRPTHRRRGVLTAMMRAHFDDVLRRGEPLAGLWASETPIYGRFGYGSVGDHHEVRVDARMIRFLGEPPVGEVRLLEPEAAPDVIPPIYERARHQRPGMLARTEAWWQHRRFPDTPEFRGGASARRWVVFEEDGVDTGYAAFRQRPKWDDGLPEGTIDVVEVQAATPGAREALWRFLASVDLFPHVKYWNAPVDDALSWIVDNRRRIERKVSDNLWLRIMDVPAALAARRYRADGNIVIHVIDRFLPGNEGAYRLEVVDGAATCRPTADDADVSMDIAELGAIYLGGRSASMPAAAGRIHGSDEAIAALDGMFGWDPAPWCPEVF